MNALCTLVEQEMFSSPGEKCQRNVTDLAGSLITSSRPPGRPQKMRRCRGKNSWWQPADRRCWRRAMSELYKNGWTDQDAVGGRFAWTRETTRYTAVKVAPIEWVILWGFAWDKMQKWGCNYKGGLGHLLFLLWNFSLFDGACLFRFLPLLRSLLTLSSPRMKLLFPQVLLKLLPKYTTSVPLPSRVSVCPLFAVTRLLS